MPNFWKRHLYPVDILSEAIYGVLIVMTFTMAVRAFNPEFAAAPDAEDMVHNLFAAAIGCAIAWGLIDSVIYVLRSLAERGEERRYVYMIQSAKDHGQAAENAAEMLEDRLGVATSREERRRLAAVMISNLAGRELPDVWVERDDILGAMAIFTVAVACTLPVVLPLLLVRDPFLALHISNFISIGYLFLTGYTWGRYAGARPLRSGFLVAVIGTLLVLLAIPLGG